MEQTPKKELTLFDSTCLIARIIIGASEFKRPNLRDRVPIIVDFRHPLPSFIIPPFLQFSLKPQITKLKSTARNPCFLKYKHRLPPVGKLQTNIS